MNHAFVSSSNRENSTIQQALAHWKDQKHQALLDAAEAHGLQVWPGIGHWTDGAEETAHLKGWDAPEVAEKLGREHGQKSVLLFSPTVHGPDRLHHFKGVTDARAIRETLSPHATTTPEGTWVAEQEASPEFLEKAKKFPGHRYTQGKVVERATNDAE